MTTKKYMQIREVLSEITASCHRFLRNLPQGKGRDISRVKGKGDVVTEADLQAEALIKSRLSGIYPEIPILTEETPWQSVNNDRLFLVDPLDGTTNFKQGLSLFSVAIAYFESGEVKASAATVGDRADHFSAARGDGAFLNGQRLQVEPRPLGPLSLVAVPSHDSARLAPMLEWLTRRGVKIRNFGSVIYHLCQVAAGRFDLCLCQDIRLWDLAAPALIISEAGGYVGDFLGHPVFPLKSLEPELQQKSFHFIASNGLTHKEIPMDILAV